MKFKYLIDDITINLYYFEDFANMKHIKRKCNPTTYYLKFTFNKRIISKVRTLGKLCPKIKKKWLARHNFKDEMTKL